MSLELMKCITDELETVTWSVYPSIYAGLGYNSSDIFFLVIEQGIYKWMQKKADEWKSIQCPSVGVIQPPTGAPIQFATTFKTRVNIAPLANMDLVIDSPWPDKIIIPGPFRLCTFLHQAFHPNYPLPSSIDTDPIVYSKAFFEAVCMWMNALWTIEINDPSNTSIAAATGTGIILFPGIKVMADLFAKACKIYKPKNHYLYFAIFAFFLYLGVQGNLTLPIPTTGIAAPGPYNGMTLPLAFPILDEPSLPSVPTIPGLVLPEFKLPELPEFEIPEYPGLPGLPDISFAVPEINLEFVLPILELPDWKALVDLMINMYGFPFTLGGFEFWSIGEFEFRVQFPDFGPFTLDDILKAFDVTLPEFCISTNLFSLPTFSMPQMTFLAWSPTVLACSNNLDKATEELVKNSNDLHKEALSNGTMNTFQLSAIMKNVCDTGNLPDPPVVNLGGFSTGFSLGFEVYIYDGYVADDNDISGPFCRADYDIFTSATFNKQWNNSSNSTFNKADSLSNVMSNFGIGSVEGPDDGILIINKYKVFKPKVMAFKPNGVPFVERF